MTGAATQASFVQHGMRMADRGAGAAAYHMPLIIHLEADVETDELAKACAALVDRHPLLGAALVDRDGIAYIERAENAPALRIAELWERVEDEIAQAFDLEHGPLVRFAVFGGDLVVTAHHAVFDGASKDIVVRDLMALLTGADPGPVPADFGQHAEAERRRVDDLLPAAREFWGPRWREPAPAVVRGAVLGSRRAATGAVIEAELPRVEVSGLTVFETTMSAVHAVLFGYGNERVVTAIDLSTRTPETADVVGPFVNELPLMSEPEEGLGFRGFGLRVRAELRELYRFREVPLARAVPRIAPHAALAPISVSYRKREGAAAHGAAGGVDWLTFNGAVRGDLQLQIVDDGDRLVSSLRYSSQAATAAPHFLDDLATALRRVAANAEVRLSELVTLEPAAPSATREAPASEAAPAQTDQNPESAGASALDLVEQVRAIWQDVLGIARIEVDDDLFELGGHSLTITRIIARMRSTLGLDVPLDVLFDNPTIAGALDAADHS